MAKLTSKKRNRLPSSDFAEPGKRKYPVNNESHARNALSRVSQYGTPEEKKKVRAKVHRKFPGIGGKKLGHRKTTNRTRGTRKRMAKR